MHYHLDEDQTQIVARLARERFGLIVSSSHKLGMDRLSDEEQIQFVTEQGVCLVTRNRDDFIAITRRLQRSGTAFSSVLIVPESMPGNDFFRIARALAYFHHLYPEPYIPGLVGYLHDPPEDWQP